jgi:hypothetical protein
MNKQALRKEVMGVCKKQEASIEEKGDGSMQQTRNKH